MKKKLLLLSIFVSISLLVVDAQAAKKISSTKSKSILSIRPHFGVGTDDSKHFGGRILLKSGKKQAYGLEFTRFEIEDESNSTEKIKFNTIGIVLEQKLFGWFNMSIGTVGYFDYGPDEQNVVGLVSNLGWEPSYTGWFKPFVTFRNDLIFDTDETKSISSISLGMKISF